MYQLTQAVVCVYVCVCVCVCVCEKGCRDNDRR